MHAKPWVKRSLSPSLRCHLREDLRRGRTPEAELVHEISLEHGEVRLRTDWITRRHVVVPDLEVETLEEDVRRGQYRQREVPGRGERVERFRSTRRCGGAVQIDADVRIGRTANVPRVAGWTLR